MKKAELKEIANRVVDVLREMPDGTEISAAQLLVQNGYDLKEFDMSELFDYNDYLFRAAKKNLITLDLSKHDGLVEGLPFNLDFVVRHRKPSKPRRKKIPTDFEKTGLIEEYGFFGGGEQEEPESYETNDGEMHKQYLDLAKKLGIEVDVPDDEE